LKLEKKSIEKQDTIKRPESTWVNPQNM
jgi:hypothetical protein